MEGADTSKFEITKKLNHGHAIVCWVYETKQMLSTTQIVHFVRLLPYHAVSWDNAIFARGYLGYLEPTLLLKATTKTLARLRSAEVQIISIATFKGMPKRLCVKNILKNIFWLLISVFKGPS